MYKQESVEKYETFLREVTNALVKYNTECIINDSKNEEDNTRSNNYYTKEITEANECLKTIIDEKIYSFETFEEYFYILKNDDFNSFFLELNLIDYCFMWENYFYSITEILFDGVDYDFSELEYLDNEYKKCFGYAQKQGLIAKTFSAQTTASYQVFNPKKKRLSNPRKLALLHELGIFDLPKMKNLSDDSQNEIISLLLDADKTEFVYKNRLNINSKDPSYQIDKYGAYKYLDEMKRLISDI